MTIVVDGVAGATLDEMHVGDIHGALGTIRTCDTAPRKTPWAPRQLR